MKKRALTVKQIDTAAHQSCEPDQRQPEIKGVAPFMAKEPENHPVAPFRRGANALSVTDSSPGQVGDDPTYILSGTDLDLSQKLLFYPAARIHRLHRLLQSSR
jgi:hypothetical protein